MYILVKNIYEQDGYTLHGATEDDKVAQAWNAAGGFVFDLDVDDEISSVSYSPVDYDESEEE